MKGVHDSTSSGNLRSDVSCCCVMEDGLHTDVMKGMITNRTRDDLMAFAAAQADARLGRREAVCAAGRVELLQTPSNVRVCVVALRVLCLRRLWMWLTQLSWSCGGFCDNVAVCET